jgi:hypothetical protein
MNGAVGAIVTIATAIVGVALLAVLVSKNAQTPQVVQAFGSAFSGALTAATGPVSGGFGGGSYTSPHF